jgi:hypothetical protein
MEDLPDFGSPLVIVGILLVMVALALVFRRRLRARATRPSSPMPVPSPAVKEASLLDSSHILDAPIGMRAGRR